MTTDPIEVPAEIQAEAKLLLARWLDAYDAYGTPGDPFDNQVHFLAEEAAFHVAVEYVEEHDLSHSVFDPRNGVPEARKIVAS